MKRWIFLIGILWTAGAAGQDYLIDFSGSGTPIDIVIVENLSTGESVTLTGADVLNLKGVTGIIDNNTTTGMKIYPNPVSSDRYATIEVNPPSPGEAVISVFDISGRQVAQMDSYLENSTQEFRISNAGKGFYIIHIAGTDYQLTGKLVSDGRSGGRISIEKMAGNMIFDVKEIKSARQAQGIIVMFYSPGERLKFTAVSGEARTTLTDIPDQTKTLSFDLLAIKDQDNNDYHMVEMGDQTWMEENLKSTRFSDGSLIPLITDSVAWSNLNTPGYSWYSNDEETFKNPYGALYNGYTVGAGNVCPAGWHVPTVEEWISMKDYLAVNGFGYQGDQEAVAKSIASKTGWEIPQPVLYQGNLIPVPDDVVGKDQQKNNSTGFNGFPAGMRGLDGAFSSIGSQAVWYSASGTTTAADFSIGSRSPVLQQGYDYRQAGFSIRCIKGESKTLPNLITTDVFNITQTTATSGATIVGTGESPVTSRGVCWDTSGIRYPTIEDNLTVDGPGTSDFTSQITGLEPGTVYYLRSYAITSDGIAYGTLEVFTTQIADTDGNIYNTILLGGNIWMRENLKTTRYNDSTAIPLVAENSLWSGLSDPAYCWYDNDSVAYKEPYGALYNWYSVNTGNLCPLNWHVPSDSEWTELTDFLAGESVAGGRLKETGTQHWSSPNAEATDDSKFTALPGGERVASGSFDNLGLNGSWWSSSEYNPNNAWTRRLTYENGTAAKVYTNKSEGLSVRCLKKAN